LKVSLKGHDLLKIPSTKSLYSEIGGTKGLVTFIIFSSYKINT